MKKDECRLLTIYQKSRRLGRPAIAIYYQMSPKDQGLLISEVYFFIKAGNVLPPELKFLQDTASYRRLAGSSRKRKARSRSDTPRGKQAEKKAINRKLSAITSCWRPTKIYARPGTMELVNGLDDQDKELARLWAQGCEDQEYHENFLAKMYSARLAEKAVMQFYRRAGHDVRDTSVQQLGNGEEWITHDLMVDNHVPIDVKNARTSVNSGSHYSEFVVPKLKQTSRDIHRNAAPVEVRIVGVLSPFLPKRDFCSPKHSYDPEVTVLGEISESEIKNLTQQFTTERLDLHILPQPRAPWESATYSYVFPPWLFSYPEYLYMDFHQCLRELNNITSSQIPDLKQLRRIDRQPPFHIFLAAGKPVPEQWQNDLAPWQLDFCEMIVEHNQDLKLPFLFLTLLHHFTDKLHNPTHDYHPNGYRELIFGDRIGGMKRDRTHPLGIYDPLCVVHELIINLASIWKVRKQYQLDCIQQFQFRGLGILRGRLPDRDHWTTVLAYCGGTIPEKRNANCGNPNLILGADGVEECPSCHRLICPDSRCRYCWKDCSEYHNRLSISEQIEECY